MQKFEKWQGCGNDFILIDRVGNAIDEPEKIKWLCDRHFGIGADGVIYVQNSTKAAHSQNMLSYVRLHPQNRIF
ncbi:MAG: hypothetical protein IKI68_02940 [Clostridia bacterium]|nr:hypothetical protein [Clostridia bacterium]